MLVFLVLAVLVHLLVFCPYVQGKCIYFRILCSDTYVVKLCY